MEKLDLTTRHKHFDRRPRVCRSVSETFGKSFSTCIDVLRENINFCIPKNKKIDEGFLLKITLSSF